MHLGRATLVFLCLLSCADLVSGKAKKAAETRPEHEPLIRQGMALHDDGKYAEAIAEYGKVLAENPDDALAIYETAYAYAAGKDWKQCLSWSQRGLRYESSAVLRLRLIVILGSCEDENGQSDKAVRTYKRGIKEFPEASMLHYNLGVTYFRLAKTKEARRSFQSALRADPHHASSHFMLGQVYLETQYRVPGILALSRFLTLEPASPRSVNALQMLLNAVQAGVENKGGGTINVTLFMPEKKITDEGDFQSADLFLSLMAAGLHMEKLKDNPPHTKLESVFGGLFENVARSEGKPSGFADMFYSPYFAELHKKGYTPTFLRFALRNLKGADDAEWMEQNREKLREFLAWSEAYEWQMK